MRILLRELAQILPNGPSSSFPHHPNQDLIWHVLRKRIKVSRNTSPIPHYHSSPADLLRSLALANHSPKMFSKLFILALPLLAIATPFMARDEPSCQTSGISCCEDSDMVDVRPTFNTAHLLCQILTVSTSCR